MGEGKTIEVQRKSKSTANKTRRKGFLALATKLSAMGRKLQAPEPDRSKPSNAAAGT